MTVFLEEELDMPMVADKPKIKTKFDSVNRLISNIKTTFDIENYDANILSENGIVFIIERGEITFPNIKEVEGMYVNHPMVLNYINNHLNRIKGA